jgi:hypothetical protein
MVLAMSDIPDYGGQLDMRKVIAEIDRDRAETQKLFAEARKFNRDRWIVPLTAIITVIGGILVGAVARLPEILHAFGVGR